MLKYGEYQFEVGNLVQLAPGAPVQQVIWRGQQLGRLASGTRCRQNVYLLDDEFWDCYHEQELRGAWSADVGT